MIQATLADKYQEQPAIALTESNVITSIRAGLCVANLFSFALAVATSIAPQQIDAASARLSLGGGIAIFLAPFILGWAADNFGIQRAFTVVLVLLIMAVGATLFANRLAKQK